LSKLPLKFKSGYSSRYHPKNLDGRHAARRQPHLSNEPLHAKEHYGPQSTIIKDFIALKEQIVGKSSTAESVESLSLE